MPTRHDTGTSRGYVSLVLMLRRSRLERKIAKVTCARNEFLELGGRDDSELMGELQAKIDSLGRKLEEVNASLDRFSPVR